MAYEDDELEDANTKDESEQSDLSNEVEASDKEAEDTDTNPSDDETDKEYDASEEIAKEAQPLEEDAKDLRQPAAPPELPKEESSPESTQLNRYQKFINEYKALQDQRKQGMKTAGLLEAGGRIGSALAGANNAFSKPTFDPAIYEHMRQRANLPVNDFEQGQIVQGRGMQLQQTVDANDPASPQSKLTRDFLKTKLGINLPDNVSAADAQMLLKTVGKPVQKGFQKVNGTWTDEKGEHKNGSAIFDPASGQYLHPDTHQPIPGFHAESLNPYQTVINPNTGERELFNKSVGGAPTPITTGKSDLLSAAKNPNEVYAALTPDVRKELQNKIAPDFNKSTEKTRQRLTHVPVIIQRLKDAQSNPAALPQLKAELARFDVGDQRLAQQEFNMFGQRMGYKGIQDWLNAHSTGTISPDFAASMGQAIQNVAGDLGNELNEEAEKRANLVINRLPKEKQVKPELIAPLIYGGYKPKAQGSDEEVRQTKDGKKAVFNRKTKEFIRWADEGQ